MEIKIRYVNMLCIAAVACLAIYTNRMTSKVKGVVPSIEVTSTAFKNGERIGIQFSCFGSNPTHSPPLAWTKPDDQSIKGFALICRDIAPSAHSWTHWIVFNIPASVTSMAEGVSHTAWISGVKEGNNSGGTEGYRGPCPPDGIHTYVFTIYALDIMLDLPAGATAQEVEKAIAGHIKAQGELQGVYEAPARRQ